jgi:hypothetical protein
MSSHALRAVLPVLAACALVTGCGTADSRRDAEAVAERFHAALAERDGATACEQLGEDTVSALEQQEERPCEEAILGLDLPEGGAAARADVEVTDASVVISSGGTVFLDEHPEGWRISAAGCRPKAPELPYDCELED